jgi:RNA polymerase sigma factor (TIGR02999 family)
MPRKSAISSRRETHTAEQLLPLVYDDLRKLAAAKMAQEGPGQTLQATGLVHEAYLRLVDVEMIQHWNSHGHSISAAADAMRRIPIGQARRKRSQRAGGDRQRLNLSDVEPDIRGPQLDLVALDEAIKHLAARDPRASELVKLRFFAGLSHTEAAASLDRSPHG